MTGASMPGLTGVHSVCAVARLLLRGITHLANVFGTILGPLFPTACLPLTSESVPTYAAEEMLRLPACSPPCLGSPS
jgi:hypothetical protein